MRKYFYVVRGAIEFNRELTPAGPEARLPDRQGRERAKRVAINANRLEFTRRAGFRPANSHDFVKRCVIGLAFMGLGVFADPVVTIQITLDNRLDLPRENELVIVTLRQLNIAGDAALKDVEVFERQGNEQTALPSQLDDLLKDGIDDGDEVSFLVSMPAASSKTITVKLLDQRKEKESRLMINQTGNGDVLVTMPGKLALSFDEYPWGGYSVIPLFLLTSDISLLEPARIAVIRRGVRKRQKVVFHSGPARGVVVLAGSIYRHYGGGRGWDISGFEDREVFSISTADGSILCETYIKSKKDTAPFHDFRGNIVSLNTKDFQWQVFSPHEGKPGQIYAAQFNPKAEATNAPGWGWALGTRADASMVMAVSTNKGAFGHIVDIRNVGESNYWRLRPLGGVAFAEKEKKWQVLYTVLPEKVETERARQIFMKLNSPLFTP